MSGPEIPPLPVEPEFFVVSRQNHSFGGRALMLALRYAGHTVSFGDALPADQRADVAKELRRVLAAR